MANDTSARDSFSDGQFDYLGFDEAHEYSKGAQRVAQIEQVGIHERELTTTIVYLIPTPDMQAYAANLIDRKRRLIEQITQGVGAVEDVADPVPSSFAAIKSLATDVRRMATDPALSFAASADAPWTCPGCHRRIDETQADMIIDHVRDCDLVDGAGHPIGG